MSTLDLPVVNVTIYLFQKDSSEALEECRKAAKSFKMYSAFAVHDYRVSEKDNSRFINLQEDYSIQSTIEKMNDTRPQFHYQVGTTPELTEKPKCGSSGDCLEFIKKLDPKDRPHDFSGYDPKWRFFWRIGSRPKKSQFMTLNAPQVVPLNFPNWKNDMNIWGGKLVNTVEVLAEMLAIGLDLPKDTFSKLLKDGAHLLAPTASDMSKYGELHTVLAGFHADLNFMTIHGKSKYPGLDIWTRQGEKLSAKIPNGCLLVQSGKQFEWLTGGLITAGYHQVVVNKDTIKAIQRQKETGRPNWRISSTLFSHVAADNFLEPIHPYENSKYPRILAGDQVKAELKEINLSNY
jgi:isopenicillin N synthase-like dioxygenase